MLVIDDNLEFGILWEVISTSEDESFYYGICKILIDGEFFPKKERFDNTINAIFHNMKKAFKNPYYPCGFINGEIGLKLITDRQLSYGEIPDIINIELADIGNCFAGYEEYGSLVLNLGYANDMERLFYSEDNGKTFREIKLKKGTVEKVIMSLPEELRKE